MSTDPPVAWPALLKLENEDDVTVVSSWEEWVRDTDISGFPETGRLVANDGEVFELLFETAPFAQRFWDGRRGLLRPVSLGERFTRSQWVAYVREYVNWLGPVASRELEELGQSLSTELLPAAIFDLLQRWKKP